MTEHLPECLIDDQTYGLSGLCICNELRAAEQRVRKEECVAYEEAVVLAEAESFAAGVKAAREAVAAVPDYPETVYVRKPDVLDAIDALLTERQQRK
jgi:hypothetical protein